MSKLDSVTFGRYETVNEYFCLCQNAKTVGVSQGPTILSDHIKLDWPQMQQILRYQVEGSV